MRSSGLSHHTSKPHQLQRMQVVVHVHAERQSWRRALRPPSLPRCPPPPLDFPLCTSLRLRVDCSTFTRLDSDGEAEAEASLEEEEGSRSCLSRLVLERAAA